MSDNSESENQLNRRRLLGLLGSGTAATVFATEIGGAKPGKGRGRGRHRRGGRGGAGRGVGPCTCDGCPDGTFCGKVEGPPEEGRTYTFSSSEDSYSVTIESVRKKEGDEITCFTFSTSDNVERVCVKGGPDINSYSGDIEGDVLCAPINPGGQQSEISNFSFCGSGCTCTQVDLVWWKDGYPIENLSTDNLYGDNLIESYHDDTCNDAGPATFNYDNPTVERDDCEITIGTISWTVNNGQITAGFELDCEEDAEVEVGLVSYEDPCDYPDGDLTDMFNIEDQVLVDSATDRFSDDGELTVDVPL